MSKHPSLIPTGGPEALLDMSDIFHSLSSDSQTISTQEITFNRSRHITYWLRCARTFLPNAYESGDASRMLFAFFIVSALDLLGQLDPDPETGQSKITDEEKRGWIDWIYHCQHPEGGFRGFTGTILKNGENCAWDLANLPSTFFALCTLLVLGDDLTRVRRASCLQWVKKLQRADGSFGEVLSERDEIQGGRDLRFCCCAAGILHILNDALGVVNDSIIFDGQAMLKYVQSCQSYEGGFSEGPYREAHSGLNYCAIGALSFYKKVLGREYDQILGGNHDLIMEASTKWIIQRQTTYIVEEDEDSDVEDQAIYKSSMLPTTPPDGSLVPHDLLFAGFNGRTNKVADTCYAFWNIGALAMLDKQHLIDQDRLRRYLLAKVQHAIGGFGKGVGEPPDVLHAYLGLATLSILGRDGLKELEPTFCISVDAVRRIEELSRKKK